MSPRAVDKFRAIGLALGTAMVAHNVIVLRADRATHMARVRRALMQTRPGR
jgi:hypothetical protein